MVDPRVYLEKITAFVRLLRMEGLVIGNQETADACRILIALGMESREQVKTALKTVFAKSREEQIIFDRVFDAFFVSEEEHRRRMEQQKQQDEALEQLLSGNSESSSMVLDNNPMAGLMQMADGEREFAGGHR